MVFAVARGQVRHARPRGPAKRRNSQVRRVETAGNRQNSDSPLSAQKPEEPVASTTSLTVGTRREDGDSVAHDPAASPQGPAGQGVEEQEAGAQTEPAAPWGG